MNFIINVKKIAYNKHNVDIYLLKNYFHRKMNKKPVIGKFPLYKENIEFET